MEFSSSDISYTRFIFGSPGKIDSNLTYSSRKGKCDFISALILRLYYKTPSATLILSGGKGLNADIPEAEAMSELACDLGVPREHLVLETESNSTADHARFLKPTLKNSEFLLVTSASHMPRAVAFFASLGMHPIPAATGHLVKDSAGSVMPSVSNLKKSQAAFYEILATVKMKIFLEKVSTKASTSKDPAAE